MRIERTGNIPPLTPRVQRFLKEALGAKELDGLQSEERLRADYSCLRGLLAIEMKTLMEDGSERLDNLTNELSERDDWPRFLGSAPIQSFLKHTNDPDGLYKKVLDRIGRAVVNHLKKANRQLEAHQHDFPRQNMAKALLLINEDHEVYDPHTVSYILWYALRRHENDIPLYQHIDLVIYMSERHATVMNGLVTFPVLIMDGYGSFMAPWKKQVGEWFPKRWAAWNNHPPMEANFDPSRFTTIDHIPDVAPRHERWRTDYRRNPYMARYSIEQLRDRFDEIMLIFELGFIVGSPLKPPREITTDNMAVMTHMMVEMGERAIPATEFRPEKQRTIAAANRLGLGKQVLDWVAQLPYPAA